jgi:D-alanyl-lipoteichoic acid acyltransferase DltB (MBOAT superfamily)
MIFSSLQYLFFLPLVVILYWRTKGSVRMWLLVAASYYFYMSWLPAYGILLLALTVFNWLIGQALFKAVTGPEGKKSASAKLLLALGLALNIGSLFYYKYTNFLIQTFGSAYNWFCEALSLVTPAALHIQPWDYPVFQILLPLAISFFVFEFVHYLVDIYRGDKPVSSFTHFMVFSSFFPSQIAGPIKRYQEFVEQLFKPERFTSALAAEGIGLFVQGLFKKVAIADPIGSLIFPYYGQAGPVSGPDAWLVSIGFVIQVYCDFSAYTDMGRGSALLMGIRLPENFQLPYLSRDIADFWRRWHMSLSFWLRDYVYIPLGGSKKDRWLNWRNLFATMVVCGFWHGVGWHYILFGVLQGIGMIVNREWRLFLRSPQWRLFAMQFKFEHRLNNEYFGWFNNLLTMLFIMLTFIVFRAPDMPHAFNLFEGLVRAGGECTLLEPIIKAGLIPITAVYIFGWLATEFIKRHPEPFRFIRDPQIGYAYPFKLATWTAAVILTIAARPLAAVPFVYFQF